MPKKPTANMPGRQKPLGKGVWAYVPATLPPDLKINWQIASTMSMTDRSLSQLAGRARNLPNPHLLIRPFIRKEAILSSQIEGTVTSLHQLLLLEVMDKAEKKDDSVRIHDAREVHNYVQALNFGLRKVNELPFSTRLIKRMHRILMQGVRGKNKAPGEFRRIQNWLGSPGCLIEEASYVPPPPNLLPQLMSDLEIYYHADLSYPPLIKICLMHYQFEAIHPFIDGNGRIGRLLIALMMCFEGLLPQPLLYLSAFFERHRDEYYNLLLRVSEHGEWDGWVEFFLRGVDEQSRDALWRVEQLLDLRLFYRRQLESRRASALLIGVLDGLFASPIITIPLAAKRLNVTYTTARKNVNKLVEAGILEEITGFRRNRIFAARAIIDLVLADKPD